jgi:MoaA/NifB/PqqE/SkfB family radical SAM enzyme
VSERFGSWFAEGNTTTPTSVEEWSLAAEGNFLIGSRSSNLANAVFPDGICFHTNDAPQDLTMIIEPTSRCNFSCGFCYGRHIAQGSLDLQDLIKMLENLPILNAVQLVGEGEPFVHSRFFDLLTEVKRRGIWVHVTTNGSLLTKDMIERLFNTGLDSLAFSLESLRPERFRLIRKSGDLSVLQRSLRAVAEKKHSSRSPMMVGLWVSVLRDTLDELPEIVALKKELGLDFLELQPLNSMTTYRQFYDDFLEKNIPTKEDFAISFQRECNPEVRLLLEQLLNYGGTGRRCEVFFGWLQAMWHGGVTPCCLIRTPHFRSLGDLRQENFADIWDKPEFRVFRFALQHGIVMAACDGCAAIRHAPGLISRGQPKLASQALTTIRTAR